MTRQMIKAGHIIAFQDGGHRHLRDGMVVWEDDKIIHVGKSLDGAMAEGVEAPEKVVSRGFINTDVHMTESPLDKSFVEDRGPRNFHLPGLFEFLTARNVSITRDGGSPPGPRQTFCCGKGGACSWRRFGIRSATSSIRRRRRT